MRSALQLKLQQMSEDHSKTPRMFKWRSRLSQYKFTAHRTHQKDESAVTVTRLRAAMLLISTGRELNENRILEIYERF